MVTISDISAADKEIHECKRKLLGKSLEINQTIDFFTIVAIYFVNTLNYPKRNTGTSKFGLSTFLILYFMSPTAALFTVSTTFYSLCIVIES